MCLLIDKCVFIQVYNDRYVCRAFVCGWYVSGMRVYVDGYVCLYMSVDGYVCVCTCVC